MQNLKKEISKTKEIFLMCQYLKCVWCFDIDIKAVYIYLCVFSFQFLQIHDRIQGCCFKDLKISQKAIF